MQVLSPIKYTRLAFIKPLLWLFGLLGFVLMTRTYYLNSALFKSWTPYLNANQNLVFLLLMASIYMVLLSIPFLPGLELGLLLMCVAGTKMVIIIYLFTVLGLTLSFLMGRWLPMKWIQFVFRKRGASSIENQALSNMTLIHQHVEKRFGRRLSSFIKKYPYLIVALLLNLPGNFILGGGGGIAMLSGQNTQISLKAFVTTIVFATLPLPVLILFGFIQLERFV